MQLMPAPMRRKPAAAVGARVRDITDVRKAGDGWDVDGKIEQRSTWRDRDGKAKNFSCRVRFGAVEDVRIEGDVVALLDD